MGYSSFRSLCLCVGTLVIAGAGFILPGYSQSGGGIRTLGISTDGSVRFKWKANSEGDLAGYVLWVGTAPGIYTGVVDVGLVTSCRLTNLMRGMRYYFALTAYNTIGRESDFTPELTYQIPLAVPASGATLAEDQIQHIPTNAAPYFEPVPDIVLEAGTTNYSVLLLGINAGGSGELNPLVVSASSSRPDLIPAPEVSYSSPEPIAVLSLNPLPDATGTVTITATVNDGQAENSSFSRSFSVTIAPGNSPPGLSQIADQVLSRNRVSHPIPFKVSDAETSTSDLHVEVVSSNPLILPSSALMIAGEGNYRTLVIDPRHALAGTVIVTLLVADELSSSSMSFAVTIQEPEFEMITTWGEWFEQLVRDWTTP